MYTIQDAISDLNDIQFCDNTWQEADAARQEVANIITRIYAQQNGVVVALRALVIAVEKYQTPVDERLNIAINRAKEVINV
jgi:hypothetical protein